MGAMSLDGKTIHGAARQHDRSPFLRVSAFEHGTGIALGPIEVANGTHKITVMRTLLQELDLRGRIVTLDALHTQGETALLRVRECRQTMG